MLQIFIMMLSIFFSNLTQRSVIMTVVYVGLGLSRDTLCRLGAPVLGDMTVV